MTLETRFWSKVIPEPNSGCFLWVGATSGGYGTLRGDDGRVRKAHRIVWELTYGQIPEGLEVMHKCDNPCCVNPLHLEVGSHARNLKDAYLRGLLSLNFGTKSPNAKLTEKDVLAIRASGETQEVLATRYGVGQSQISRIRLRQAWRHL